MIARIIVILVMPLSVTILVMAAVNVPIETEISMAAIQPQPPDGLRETVARIDQLVDETWSRSAIEPAPPADDIVLLRRLSLALHGTIPSLEQIRAFQSDDAPNRVSRWTEHLLADSRFADYFAERLARVYVGTENGPFIQFRRDRFVSWLGEALLENRPYDLIVRDILSEHGLWTDRPATNFITAGVANGELDENKLAGRTVRAFLGQRIDCAQCHDHPFDDWKQSDFEGIAAFFGQTKLSLLGVQDDTNRVYEIEIAESDETRIVSAGVPFHDSWLPADGPLRERLAHWLTHRDNRRFERSIANRVWGLMFGRPFIEPVDDIPDPGDETDPDVLDILGADFREHGYDLRRLISVIAATKPFRLDSTHEFASDAATVESLESVWAIFPLVRLRPEQIIGAMLQASTVKTIDQNTHVLFRAIKQLRSNAFVKEYGDLGDDELQNRPGTIAQALLRMNGEFSADASHATIFSSAGRVASWSSNDGTCIENCFFVCLTRAPTEQELTHFTKQLSGTTGKQRSSLVEDLYWSLLNSPEFSWNH